MATFITADPAWIAAAVTALRSRGFRQVDRVEGRQQYSVREQDGETWIRWVDGDDPTGHQLEPARPVVVAPEDPVDRALAALCSAAWVRVIDAEVAARVALRTRLPLPIELEDC